MRQTVRNRTVPSGAGRPRTRRVTEAPSFRVPRPGAWLAAGLGHGPTARRRLREATEDEASRRGSRRRLRAGRARGRRAAARPSRARPLGDPHGPGGSRPRRGHDQRHGNRGARVRARSLEPARREGPADPAQARGGARAGRGDPRPRHQRVPPRQRQARGARGAQAERGEAEAAGPRPDARRPQGPGRRGPDRRRGPRGQAAPDAGAARRGALVRGPAPRGPGEPAQGRGPAGQDHGVDRQRRERARRGARGPRPRGTDAREGAPGVGAAARPRHDQGRPGRGADLGGGGGGRRRPQGRRAGAPRRPQHLPRPGDPLRRPRPARGRGHAGARAPQRDRRRSTAPCLPSCPR